MTRVSRIGVVGTGEMGRPLIGRLLAAGHDVAAYARRPEARDELASSGVSVVGSLTELGAGRDIVIVYVFSDEQVRSVVLDQGLLEAMAPGSTLVIHTTGSQETAQAIAAAAAPRGVSVVDAPGSGGPAEVANGNLTLFAGGDETAVDALLPLFAAYATKTVRFGPVGAGQAVKLVNNLLFAAQVQLALDAARLAESFEIDVLAMAETLRTCSGASAALGILAGMGSVQALLEAGGPFIYKDARLTQQIASDAGLPLGSFSGVITDVVRTTAPFAANDKEQP